MPKLGDVIAGKYRLDKVAGEGGMGLVYAAHHLVLDQRVAVKILLPDAASADGVLERFAREAQAAARIQSEHVARVMDAGSLDTGAPFLVMEYLEGCDLQELIELGGRLKVDEVADYLLQALEAVAHAHAVGIVHRDLKPANLFLACRPDGGNAIKILDFGISKTKKATPDEKVLTGHAVLGSPVYMSPEQLRNAKEIDGRADLWSLGIVAYEMLTGTVPFDGDGVGEIFAAILEQDPVPPHERNPLIPVGLSEVILRCLRRNPDERYPDAAALSAALAPFGSGAWAPLTDRTESVLTRAKMLSVMSTPIEARRVVDLIELAAERAKTTFGSGDVPPPPPSSRHGFAREDDAARDRDREDRVAKVKAGGRSLPRWTPIAAAVALAAAVVGVIALVVVPRSSSVASTGRVDTPPPPEQALTATPAASDEAPVVMDLPDDTPAKRQMRRAAPATKPSQRPKFLNSRE